MIHTIKNIKWVIATFLVCILLGVFTFYTFVNKGLAELNESNLQILLLLDLVSLSLFFILIIREIYKVLKERKKKTLGSQTILRYITFFSITTLLPSILIAIFSLILFNVILQKYFEKKIKNVINNSAEVSRYYVEHTRNSIEADILLMLLDVNNKSGLFYDNPQKFQNVLSSQRL